MTEGHTISFRDPTAAFDDAILVGRLSAEPSADNYAGDFMYMGTRAGIDMFKHRATRQYL